MVTIIFTGMPTYCEKTLSNLSSNFQYVWSTWANISDAHRKTIESRGVKLVLTPQPFWSGYGNINMQTVSVCAGIQQTVTPFILRFRGDMWCSDWDTFIPLLLANHKLLSCLCYHNHGGGYLVDYINFGTRHEMTKFWNYYQKDISDLFAERQLIEHYLSFYPQLNKSFECLKQYIYFFLPDMVKMGIDITWLKNNYHLGDYVNEPNHLYLPYR